MVYTYPRIPITAQPMGVRVWVLVGKSTGSPQDTRGLPVQLPSLKAQQSAHQHIQVGTLVTSLSCIGEP